MEERLLISTGIYTGDSSVYWYSQYLKACGIKRGSEHGNVKNQKGQMAENRFIGFRYISAAEHCWENFSKRSGFLWKFWRGIKALLMDSIDRTANLYNFTAIEETLEFIPFNPTNFSFFANTGSSQDGQWNGKVKIAPISMSAPTLLWQHDKRYRDISD